MNKYYLWIARMESIFFSMLVALGTLEIVGVMLLIVLERINTFLPNSSVLLITAIAMATFFIWVFSVFESFNRTHNLFEELFKIDGEKK